MGERVNFKRKNNNDIPKKIKIVGIILVSILVIYIIIKSAIRAVNSIPETNIEKKEAYYKVSDYGSFEEIMQNYNCKVISKDESSGNLVAYVSFGLDLYTGDKSNERHFVQMCRVIAEFQKFKDFELIDTNKNINIAVKCEDTNIVELKINRRC
ncbi:MAG: hypothetical protein HFJ45_00365 [Clostridia bacterium]|nr:hypothetical protein [Clostridia bacterium]